MPQASETLDARGLHVLPGAIDVHVHFRDPGYPDKEDFATGTAAVGTPVVTVGGGTSVSAAGALTATAASVAAVSAATPRYICERVSAYWSKAAPRCWGLYATKIWWIKRSFSWRRLSSAARKPVRQSVVKAPIK